jgi:hypothetical protein
MLSSLTLIMLSSLTLTVLSPLFSLIRKLNVEISSFNWIQLSSLICMSQFNFVFFSVFDIFASRHFLHRHFAFRQSALSTFCTVDIFLGRRFSRSTFFLVDVLLFDVFLSTFYFRHFSVDILLLSHILEWDLSCHLEFIGVNRYQYIINKKVH